MVGTQELPSFLWLVRILIVVTLCTFMGWGGAGCGYDGPAAGILISEPPSDPTTDVPDPDPDPDPDPVIVAATPDLQMVGELVDIIGQFWQDGDELSFTGASERVIYTTNSATLVEEALLEDVEIDIDAYTGPITLWRDGQGYPSDFDYSITPAIVEVEVVGHAIVGGYLIISATGFDWSGEELETFVYMIDDEDNVIDLVLASLARVEGEANIIEADFPVDIAAGSYDVYLSSDGVESGPFEITIENPPPTVTDVVPEQTQVTYEVTVSGEHWQDGDVIRLHGCTDGGEVFSTGSGVVVEASRDMFVSENCFTGPVTLIRDGNEYPSEVELDIIPEITGVEYMPDVDTAFLRIHGTGFDWSTPDNNDVTVEDQDGGIIVEEESRSVVVLPGDNLLELIIEPLDDGAYSVSLVVAGISAIAQDFNDDFTVGEAEP